MNRPVQNPYLLSNSIRCHCGSSSGESPSWWAVQQWWRKHGYGLRCK